ncbi:zinc-binding protein A33-like [Osmerus mordax]|uniref:zinc-binding protein A33-like n=1 Tax=Osmerus mordax TaxID=8014 RepID=UPI0035109171
MASRHSFPEEDFTCPVCFDIFDHPVILTCSHSFCQTCLQEYWKEKTFRDCPVCRNVFLMNEPPCNRALKNICEDFLKERSWKVPAECEDLVKERSRSTSTGSEVLCSLHHERLKLFCLEDEEPICVVCQTSRKHRSHGCIPLDEAAEDHRKELQTALEPLQDKIKDLNKSKKSCDETSAYVMIQIENTERQIKQEFKKLYQFLQNEEEARIAALRKEKEEKSKKLKEKIEGINKEIALISDQMQAIKAELKADDISFLQNVKATKRRARCILQVPQLDSGVLIDMAKHLGNLTLKVWEKMKGMIQKTPIILDPNTANPWLSLSKDLTRVKHQDRCQQLPNNPERFMMYYNVLGSEGFVSGKHSWEVEVGDHPRWTMGVAQESVDRKGEICITPKYGIWPIHQRTGEYKEAEGQALTLRRRPQRIRVQLDFDKGELSFHDSKDMTHIYTFKHKFTERVFPFLSVGAAGDAKTSDIQICQI